MLTPRMLAIRLFPPKHKRKEQLYTHYNKWYAVTAQYVSKSLGIRFTFVSLIFPASKSVWYFITSNYFTNMMALLPSCARRNIAVGDICRDCCNISAHSRARALSYVVPGDPIPTIRRVAQEARGPWRRSVCWYVNSSSLGRSHSRYQSY